MKNKQLPMVFVIAAMLLFSCDIPNDSDGGSEGRFPLNPQFKTFRAQNVSNNSLFQ
jgi:hypothetical protein